MYLPITEHYNSYHCILDTRMAVSTEREVETTHTVRVSALVLFPASVSTLLEAPWPLHLTTATVHIDLSAQLHLNAPNAPNVSSPAIQQPWVVQNTGCGWHSDITLANDGGRGLKGRGLKWTQSLLVQHFNKDKPHCKCVPTRRSSMALYSTLALLHQWGSKSAGWQNAVCPVEFTYGSPHFFSNLECRSLPAVKNYCLCIITKTIVVVVVGITITIITRCCMPASPISH